MTRPGTLCFLLWACLYALFTGCCPPDCGAQQPAAGSAQADPTKPGADASDSSGNPDQKLSGLAIVVRVASIAEDPLFHADGYRIRVQAGTVTAFPGSLKRLADVQPGDWVRFEGVRDDTGVLVARKAEFFPSGSRKSLTAMGPRKVKHAPDYQPVTRDGLLDADGHFVNLRAKVRFSNAGGPCGWHRVAADPPLQERVERIGMRLVPEFQKQLPLESPSRIPFRFYAVADDKVRSVFACNVGLVLVPKNVVERLQNDDQLADVLADAVAFNLERQLVTITKLDLVAGGSEVAAFISLGFPAGYIAGEFVEGLVGREAQIRLQRELARMALQLAADAGFDPWQAPEAWRLLEPKDPPGDIQSLDFTREGNYQLGILKMQYKSCPTSRSTESPTTAEGKSVQ